MICSDDACFPRYFFFFLSFLVGDTASRRLYLRRMQKNRGPIELIRKIITREQRSEGAEFVNSAYSVVHLGDI
jgi:hypothetical protein